MKTFLTLLLCVALAPLALAQNAADKIVSGRAALANHDLVTARARFEEALVLNPSSQAAGALLGFTRTFNIANQVESQAFLDRLQFSRSGRSVHDWQATFPVDGDDWPVLPPDFNFNEASAFWLGVAIPQAEQARANLALVTNPAFLISLSSAETKLPSTVNVDYGDVLMSRAALAFLEALGHAFSSNNLDLELGTLWQLERNAITLQRVLRDNPDFLKAGPLAQREATRAKLLEGIALYRQASLFIRTQRLDGLNPLFAIDADMLAEEEEFRGHLDLLERSVTEPVRLPVDDEDIYVFAGAALDPAWSLRGALPTFTENGFDFTSPMDPTFGGMVSGFTREEVANFLTDDPRTLPEMGWEWVSPLPQGNRLFRYLALPGGKHLVVGDAGAVLTSSDGVNWNPSRISGASTLNGVASGLGKVVVVAGSRIYVSSDAGATWRQAKGESYGLRGIAFGGGRFVAVGGNGSLVYSVDGETWHNSSSGNFNGNDIIHTGAFFVAVGQASNRATVLTSTDGISWWTRYTAAATGPALYAVAQGGGRFVAVGTSNQRVVSTDGVTWAAGTVAVAQSGLPAFTGVSYYNGRFIAAGASGATALLYSSTDGVMWTIPIFNSTAPLLSIGAASDAVYATGNAGTILRSTDGATFTQVYPTSAAASALGTAFFGARAIDGQLYVVGSNGVMLRSSDGVAFEPISTGTIRSLRGILKNDGLFVTVGDAGTILTSNEGANWTPQTIAPSSGGSTPSLYSLSYINDQFFATGFPGVVRSWNGTTWELQLWTYPYALYGAASGNGVTVFVGGNLSVSGDLSSGGKILTLAGPGAAVRAVGGDAWRAVVFHDGMFTAVGNKGAVAQSVDGHTWTFHNQSGASDLVNLRVLGGRYYAVENKLVPFGGQDCAVLVSGNGRDWTRVYIGSGNGFNDIELFQGRLYAVGNGTSILRSAPITDLAAPELTPLTPDTLAQQGGRLTLAVKGAGDAGLRYQWQKDGAALAGATNSVLELTNIQPGAAGTYTLVVTQGGTTVSSAPIVVTVDSTPSLPEIVAQPQSQTVPISGTAIFSVEATGSEPFSYRWKKDGVIVPGASAAVLILASVDQSHAGSYTVEVSNARGPVTSTPAVLTVDAVPTYAFTTLAGLAYQSGSQNGTGAAARFSAPTGVAADALGNVYVADSSNGVIRKITPAGAVTLLAGSPGQRGSLNGIGTAARFSNPINVALSPDGTTLYVSDYVVRKINLATLEVSNLGSYTTTALAVDAAGNVFTVSNDNTVRKITPTGVVTTLAGSTGVAGFANGTGSAARFNGPQGIALDAAGDLYVADTYNRAIRKVTPAGLVTTIAGAPTRYNSLDGPLATASFESPWGIAVDAIGSIYVTESSGQTVRKIMGSSVRTIGGVAYWGASVDGVGAEARFSGPRGIALDAGQALYIADTWGNTIRKGMPSVSPLAPLIERGPVDQIAVLGGTAVFSVSVPSSVALSYQWLKNGAPLQAQTNATLVINDVQPGNAAAYSVRVGNGYGTSTSPTALLSLATAPTITSPPVDFAAAAGDLATFTVAATGSPAPSYQWRKGGIAITGATYATLVIPNVFGTDAGNYDVVVSNLAGSVPTAPVQLTVDSSGVIGAHALVSAGYAPGRLTTVRSTVTYSGTLAALEWHALLPAGWTLVSHSATGTATAPVAGETDVLSWVWSTVPVHPATFTYTLRAPESGGGTQQITALVKFRPTGASPSVPLGQRIAQPDPLLIPVIAPHSADTDNDMTISLQELTRVIDLYNVRYRTVRTGAYKVASGFSEDGFDRDESRAAGTSATLSRYHAADTRSAGSGTPDGRISLDELTRVIEFYNVRAGSTRTGRYRVQPGTDDGFAPAP